MAKLVDNLKNGIDTKQRLMLMGVGVVVVGAGVVFLNSGSNQSVGPAAVAQIASAPENIGKTKVGETLDVPENSLLIKEKEEGQQKAIEEVRANKDNSVSHIDQLILNNEKSRDSIQNRIENRIQDKKVVTGIDAIIEEKRKEKESSQRVSDATDKKLPEIKTEPRQAPVVVVPIVEEPQVTRYQILEEFLEGEIASSTYDSSTIETKFAEIDQAISFVPTSVEISPADSRGEQAEGAPNEEGIVNYQDSDSVYTEDEPAYDVVPGETQYAVLMTSINSDNPGPIMVQIVDGGVLDGAKLIGGIEVGEDGVQLSFNTLTLDQKVYDVAAIGVDLNTDGTNMADDVNRHILSRYGSLALASFLSGYADALSATTTTVAADGTSTSQANPLPDAEDQLKLAAGNVGKTFVPILEAKFDRPPTIKLNSGKALGIMFLQGIEL